MGVCNCSMFCCTLLYPIVRCDVDRYPMSMYSMAELLDVTVPSMCAICSGGGSVVVDFLFIVTPIVGVCNGYMFCCTLLYVHSSIAIILMGKRELIALLNLSS